jgi:hypothetical protein
MVTISVTAEVFAAIEATLPKAPGSQSGREGRPDGKGGWLVVKIRQRARLLTIGERRQKDRQLGVGACAAMSRWTL